MSHGGVHDGWPSGTMVADASAGGAGARGARRSAWWGLGERGVCADGATTVATRAGWQIHQRRAAAARSRCAVAHRARGRSMPEAETQAARETVPPRGAALRNGFTAGSNAGATIGNRFTQ